MKHNHITCIPCCYRWSTAHKINNILVMTQTCIVLSCQKSEKVLKIIFLECQLSIPILIRYVPVINSALPSSWPGLILVCAHNCDSSVVHCPSLLRMIFVLLAHANEHVHIHNVKDFPQAKLHTEINACFLLNEHGDLGLDTSVDSSVECQ